MDEFSVSGPGEFGPKRSHQYHQSDRDLFWSDQISDYSANVYGEF